MITNRKNQIFDYTHKLTYKQRKKIMIENCKRFKNGSKITQGSK